MLIAFLYFFLLKKRVKQEAFATFRFHIMEYLNDREKEKTGFDDSFDPEYEEMIRKVTLWKGLVEYLF